MQYQEYDVTGLLRPGTNVIGAELGPGLVWRADRHRPRQFQRLTPTRTAARGRRPRPTTVRPSSLAATDEGWEWAASDITESDLYDGEIVDRTCSGRAGWATPDASDLGHWERMELSGGTAAALVPQTGPTVRETATQSRSRTSAGWPTAPPSSTRAATRPASCGSSWTPQPGTRVTVNYGEIVDVDGHVYRENLRSARCRDVFRCAGGPGGTRAALQPSVRSATRRSAGCPHRAR